MLTKAIIGTVAATAVGIGGASIASASSTSTPTKHDAPALRRLAAHAVHGSIVTRNRDGQFVTHDLIRGVVTSVSSSSITVLAADRTSETYAVTSTTRVRQRVDGTGSAASISTVHKGDQVFVIGTGATALTAKRIVDVH